MDKHIKLLIKSSKEFEQVCENAVFEIKNQERIGLSIRSLKASKHKPRPITIYILSKTNYKMLSAPQNQKL